MIDEQLPDVVETNPTLLPENAMLCTHAPACPDAEAPDRDAACVVAAAPEQGWSLLCNGVIRFDDTGELLPDGRAVAPHRGPAPHRATIPAPRREPVAA